MECMGEKALKASFMPETNTKSVNSQGISDDIWCVTGDDFLIDDFFNLPNDEITLKNINEEGNFVVVEEEEDEEKCCNSSGSNGFVDDSARFTEDFTVPDDMQDLELWSHLMDDSSPDSMLVYPKPSIEANNKKTGFTFVNRVEPYRHPSVVRASFFPTAVPVKPRSKRSRSIVNRSWYTSSPPKTESSSSSSSPVSTLLFSPPFHEMGMFYSHAKLPVKKPKRRPAPSFNVETTLSTSFQRRCSHCQVTKTPQWRAGPNGPKTLCNACGVRHKSGRLFPEYRPACSPTFSSEVHSNSHRKVLEMRRRKEVDEPSTDSAQLVQNGLKTE